MKDVFVTIRLDAELQEKVKEIAKINTRSMSAQILHFTKKGVEASKRKENESND